MDKKTLIVCCLHGNEGYGLNVCKSQPFFPYFLANKKALKKNKRFIDADLNRIFPGDKKGNYEERLATKIIKKIDKFDNVIDLHSSSNECPIFGIITKPNKRKILLAQKLGLKKLVIMPEFIAKGKSMIDFAKCGISLEIGPHNREENIQETLELLKNLYYKSKKDYSLEVYQIFQVIKRKSGKILIKNFQNIKNGDILTDNQRSNLNFTAVLVNENAYGDILCFAARRIEKNLGLKKY